MRPGGTKLSYKLLAAVCVTTLLLSAPAFANKEKKKESVSFQIPDLLMDGGRKLSFERMFSNEHEVKPRRAFWTKVVDVVIGAPDYHNMIRPYSVATDSKGRIIVTDPGAHGVHIFDFEKQKYKFLSRIDTGKNPLVAPQCVAVDAQDKIYVTDSESGKIFVFDPNGKFERTIGSLKYGEGYFKRPTGIAVDSAAQHIYVTDTLRHQIFVMDMHGSVLKKIGKAGTGNLEFNYPTELCLNGDEMAVVDSMNFRVQVIGKDGEFRYTIGRIGDDVGAMFRPKGVAYDSEGHLYVVDGMWSVVQVFNREGQLLYYFGQPGTTPGTFQLPTGLSIDAQDRIFVADSFNRRVQVYHYYGIGKVQAQAHTQAPPQDAAPARAEVDGSKP
jgi:DNA-binding beta-propeller fold protein YncE